MKEIISLEMPAAGAVTIPCPAGKVIRIVGVLKNITPAAGADDTDRVTVTLKPNSGSPWFVSGGDVPSAPTALSLFIGATSQALSPAVIDPVTGVVTFADQNACNFGLPDLWWNVDVNIAIALANGSVGATPGLVVYARETA